jgi:dephospho-CoA kinase
MKVVGVTGGIGSGKSIVCKLFSLLGVPVFDADAEAKKMYEQTVIKKKVVKLMGKQVLLPNGSIDKTKLSELIFADTKQLKRINSIIHPPVKKRFLTWKKANKQHSYVVKEAAIMVESGTYKEVDFLISVNAPQKMRIERLLKRGGLSVSQITQRMKLQLSDVKRNKYADAIIYNDLHHSLIEQVLQLHNHFT